MRKEANCSYRLLTRALLAALWTATALSTHGQDTVPADANVTQTATVQVADDGQGNFAPLDVKFPQEFGNTPTVSLHCSAGWSHGHAAPCVVPLNAANVTRFGFRALIGGSANASGHPVPMKLTWSATGFALQHGTVVPNYVVLTVIYAPPGTDGGHATSAVSYQAGSTAGTLTSSSETFKDGLSVSVAASGGLLTSGEIGVSFDTSHSSTDSQSLEIKKAVSTTIAQNGPASNGISHDEDEIWLLIKPKIDLALSSEVTEWTVADAKGSVLYLHVGWLNGHQAIPPGVLAVLQNAGISSDQYPDILARDPLVTDEAAFNTTRFQLVDRSFPYEPPYAPNEVVKLHVLNDSSISSIDHRGTSLWLWGGFNRSRVLRYGLPNFCLHADPFSRGSRFEGG